MGKQYQRFQVKTEQHVPKVLKKTGLMVVRRNLQKILLQLDNIFEQSQVFEKL